MRSRRPATCSFSRANVTSCRLEGQNRERPGPGRSGGGAGRNRPAARVKPRLSSCGARTPARRDRFLRRPPRRSRDRRRGSPRPCGRTPPSRTAISAGGEKFAMSTGVLMLRPRPDSGPSEARRDDRDLHLVLHLGVHDRAEDDVGLGVGGLVDDRGRVVDLEQGPCPPRRWMLMITPRAPSTEASSSSGLLIAIRAASAARLSPSAMPVPITASPIPRMIVRTSAKSRLMSPGTVIRSEMPWTACRRTSSAVAKASDSDVVRSTVWRSRSFGIEMSVSTCSRSSLAPSWACICRRRPSKVKGFVTTATVSAPSSLARDARIGAPPVPVPPSEARGDEHHVRTLDRFEDALGGPRARPSFRSRDPRRSRAPSSASRRA